MEDLDTLLDELEHVEQQGDYEDDKQSDLAFATACLYDH